MAKTAEKLVILNEHAEGLLRKLHHMRKLWSNERNRPTVVQDPGLKKLIDLVMRKFPDIPELDKVPRVGSSAAPFPFLPATTTSASCLPLRPYISSLSRWFMCQLNNAWLSPFTFCCIALAAFCCCVLLLLLCMQTPKLTSLPTWLCACGTDSGV